MRDPESMKKMIKGIALSSSLVGLLFTAIGLYSWNSTRVFLEKARRVTGEVVEIRQGDSETDGTEVSTRSVAVVQFSDEGESRTLLSQIETSPPAYTVGQKVTVLVNSDRSTEARIESWLELYFFAAVFGGLGPIMLATSALLLRLGPGAESESGSGAAT